MKQSLFIHALWALTAAGTFYAGSQWRSTSMDGKRQLADRCGRCPNRRR